MDINQSQITADQSAVATAQAAVNTAESALSTAEATLTADQATLATETSQEASLPELSVVDELESLVAAESTGLSADLQSQFTALTEQIRSQLIASLTPAVAESTGSAVTETAGAAS